MVSLDYLFEPKSHYSLLNDNYLDTSPLNYKIYYGALILPPINSQKEICGGVFSEKVLVNHTLDPHYSSIKSLSFNVDSLKIDKKVIYIGNFVKCWGHFITDCLRYAWFLKQKALFKDHQLVYVADENFKLNGNYARLLQLLDIDVNTLQRITKPTIFEECIVPDPSFYYNETEDKYYYHSEYQETINVIRKKFTNKTNEKLKIYYSYSSFKKNKINGIKKQFGEEKLEKFFKQQGFLIVKPENLTIDEQLSLLSKCEVFASTEGSSSHNSIFLPNNSTAIIIPRGPYQSGYQDVLNYAGNCNVVYIDSSLSILTNEKCPWTGPFFYFLSDELLSYFNIENHNLVLKTSKEGLRRYLNYGMTLNRTSYFACDNIYTKKLLNYLSETKRKFSFKNRIKQFLKK